MKLVSQKNILNFSITAIFLLFIYTGSMKLMDVQTFKSVLNDSPLLKSTAGFISYALPVLELVLAIGLALPQSLYLALWSSLVLLSFMTLYLIYMVNYTVKLPCGCGGVLSYLNWNQHIIFNLFFIGLSTLGIILYRKQISLNINAKRTRLGQARK